MTGPKLQNLLSMDPIETRHKFDRRDTIIYALGIGCGLGEHHEEELRYVLEDRLVAFPTMATILAYPGFWFDRPELGLEWRRMLLQAQHLVIERPIPVEGEVVGITHVTGAKDRGTGNGALIAVQRRVHDVASGDLLATTTSLISLRGDGEHEGMLGEIPQRLPSFSASPDAIGTSIPTTIGQPLIYRLSGDLNPMHCDPAVARQAGFASPIMHGLCTFGMAARGIIRSACSNDPSLLREFHAALVHPVYPGDSIAIRHQRDADGTVRFDASTDNATVLSSGLAKIAL